MNGPVVLALPDDRLCAEIVTDELVEAELRPQLHILDTRSDPRTFASAKVLVVILSGSITAENDELASRLREILRTACDSDRAIVIWTESVSDFDVGCTSYKLSCKERPRGIFRPFIPSALALKDIVAATKYKESGRDPPPPSAPRRIALRYLAAVSSAIILPVVAILSFTDVLIGLSRAVGLDQQASAEAEEAYGAIAEGDCQALRDFASGFDESYLTRAALERIELREERLRLVVVSDSFTLPLFSLPATGEALPNELAARRTGLGRARLEAEQQCTQAADAGAVELISVEVGEATFNCDRYTSGHACSVSGDSICRIETERETKVEWCP